VSPDLPDRIVVRSTHPDSGADQKLTIRRTSGNEGLLAVLMQNLAAPPVPALDPKLLGIDAVDVRAEAERQVQGYPPRAAAHFILRTCAPTCFEELARRVYSSFHTDDYPEVEIEVFSRGKTIVGLSSESQHPFMLPWRIDAGGHSRRTFDPALSKAIADLLPPDFPNRQLITGKGLAVWLVQAAMGMYRDETEHEAAEERFGKNVAVIRKRFVVTHDLVGTVASFNANVEDLWTATLSSPNLGRLSFNLELTIHDGRLSSPEPFLRDADALLKRVGAVAWIREYLVSHPKGSATIDYHNDRSISRYAQARTLEDLRSRGAHRLAAYAGPLLDRSVTVHLSNGGAFAIWIVLPDGRGFLHSNSHLTDIPSAGRDELIAATGKAESLR
jgi:hypothetical protein